MKLAAQDPSGIVRAVLDLRRRERMVRTLRASSEFDADFYLSAYPDLAAAGVDPVSHYVRHGVRDRRDPSAAFSTSGYLKANPDVARAGVNPLFHYITSGRSEGRPTGAPRSALEAPADRRWAEDDPERWAAAFGARLQARLAAAGGGELAPPFPGELTFSLFTLISDGLTRDVQALAEGVAAQLFGDFEWLVLDRGSNDPALVDFFEGVVAGDARVRFETSPMAPDPPDAGGLAGDLLRGRYVVWVGPGDRLCPDALALVAELLRREAARPPAVVYGDEQQLDADGRPAKLEWRWGFSLSQALSTAPTGRLAVLDRRAVGDAAIRPEALACGAGRWDAVLRLAERGGRVVHAPEVLCGSPPHGDPTEEGRGKADGAHSRISVVEASLRRRGLDDRLRVEPVGESYRLRRRPGAPLPALAIDFVWLGEPCRIADLESNIRLTAAVPAARRILFPAGERESLGRVAGSEDCRWLPYRDADGLSDLLGAVDDGVAVKFVIGSGARIASSSAIEDAVAVFESDATAALVGGPLVGEDGTVMSIGLVSGLEGFLASPFHGWPRARVPAHVLEPARGVDALPLQVFGLRADVLRRGVRVPGLDTDDALYGAMLCARLGGLGHGIVHLAAMQATTRFRLPEKIVPSADKRRELADAVGAEAFRWRLSPHLSRRAADFGRLANPAAAPGAWVATPSPDLLKPLNLEASARLAGRPALNLLLPGIRMINMSGGPNTALSLAYRLAAAGFPVRLIATDAPVDADREPIWDHIQSISGVGRRLTNVEIVDASDRRWPTEVGPNDIFMATAWWTAQLAKFAGRLTGGRPFVYLIQDFEPLFYASSSSYALALETYALPHIPVINTSLLKGFLAEARTGRFADPAFAAAALAFEPAVPRAHFHVEPAAPPAEKPRRRLLFYARPTAARNLFELGLAALQKLVEDGQINGRYWEVIGIGERFEPVDLGADTTLRPHPWLGFEDYTALLRGSDVLLSLMLSPHPSYPPLEMAACGGLVVTNVYANKSAERLAEISPNIIAGEATVEGVADALGRALERLADRDARAAAADIGLPSSWEESFRPIVGPLARRLVELGLRPNPEAAGDPIGCGLPGDADPPAYARFLQDSARDRAGRYPAMPEPGLLSFVTAVWNTPLAFLEILAESVDLQARDMPIEWCIVDNASTRGDVVAFLERLAAEKPYVKLVRSPRNLGIVGGARLCLEAASGRYILPLDHDDCIDPDCARVVAWTLQKHGYPPLLYTDEDKVRGAVRSGHYLKPDWDPVLFVNSCYTSHLCAIDRRTALALGAYSDPACEGSPDWDIVTRFFIAGHAPLHVPEVLYSWRMHENSTAQNMGSKPVVFTSQQAVIERFRRAQPAGEHFTLVKSPLFGQTPDWWLKRRRETPIAPVTTLFIRTAADRGRRPGPPPLAGVDHAVVEVRLGDDLGELLRHARACAQAGRRAHLMSAAVEPDDDEWMFEAAGLFELFPDTAVVGGRLHAGGAVLGAGYVLAFGKGCECPDRGRPLGDPGYQVQLWKPHSVEAVAAQHAVVDAAFLVDALEACRAWDPSFALLGGWLGVHARRTGRRVVYSPFVSARTRRDWDQAASAAERGRLVSVARGLPDRCRLWPPHMSTSAEAPYEPRRFGASAAAPVELPTYADWYGRRERLEPPASTVRFSLLTPLYIRTDPELFRATLDSVLAQGYAGFEWIVLAQGPLQPGLERILAQLAGRDARARILRRDRNLGIVKGARIAFEAATGDYIVPMDGDDLLAPDALARFAARIARDAAPPALMYTDEDIVIGDRVRSPYLRPDWDPVLDLENSWIWHAVAFRRDLARELGVYLAEGSEYCHDWDTVYRFSRAGHAPVHIPALAYHWRHHPASTSGSGQSNQGSSRSVQSLLREKIRDRGLEGRYEIAPYPIDRGIEDWRIRRRPDQPAPGITRVRLETGDGWRRRLARAAEAAGEAGLVWVVSASARFADEALATEEAAKLFDFLPEVGAVGGRLRRGDVIVAAGWMQAPGGDLVAPYDGLATGDAGPFALAWKPQAIAVAVLDCCAVRGGILKQAVAGAPATCAAQEFGFWLGRFLADRGLRVAFSPLVEAELTGSAFAPTDPGDANMVWRSLGGARPQPAIQGAGGYVPCFTG